MSADMAPRAVSARLRALAAVSDLRRERRLATKICMRPESVSRRLRVVGGLTALCVRLGRHDGSGPAGLTDRLHELGADCAKLAALLREEGEILEDLEDPPSSIELAALDEIRTERRKLADAVVAALLASPRLMRHAVVRYAALLAEELGELGFAGTPELCALAEDVASHARAAIPVLLVGPRGFPLSTLARAALTGSLAGSACRFALPASRLHSFELGTLVPALLASGPKGEGAFPHGAGALIASRFFEQDWGVQRALCDRAKRARLALVALEPCEPARGGDDHSFGGYRLPDLEVGVLDRLFLAAVPAPQPIDDTVLRQWLRRPEHWSEGRLPLERLISSLERTP